MPSMTQSSVNKVTGYRLDDLGSLFGRGRILLFMTPSPALGPPSFHHGFLQELKRLNCKTDLLYLYCVKVKNAWSLFSNPHRSVALVFWFLKCIEC